MGLGPSLPPTELARWDSVLFVKVKCLFSTMPETEIFSKLSWIETKANGGHWGDRTLYQTRSLYDRTRPVSGSGSQVWVARVLHQRVRSSPRETAKHARSIERGGAFDHDRSDAFGHAWMLIGL
jgi:hypothetical protein